MMLLRRGARPVVCLCRHEEPHPGAAAGRPLDPPDHPAVGDIWVDDVEGLRRLIEQAGDRLRDRPVTGPARCGGRSRGSGSSRPSSRGKRTSGSRGRRSRRASGTPRGRRAGAARRPGPRRGGRDRGSGRRRSGPRSRHPRPSRSARRRARPCGGRYDPRPRRFQPRGAARSERPDGGPRLRRAHDAHLHARSDETLVEAARASLGIGALTVDDEPHRARPPAPSRPARPRTVPDLLPDGSRTG